MFDKTRRLFKISKAFFGIVYLLRKAKRQGNDFGLVGKRINKLIASLGPTFVKLAQMLSLRADLIPASLADELRGLLDKGKKVRTNLITNIFKQEFEKLPEDCFEDFEEEPLAVASLAQVHKAKYKGKFIVVKVQKPHIKSVIQHDLSLIKKALFFLPAPTSKLRKSKRLLKRIISEFFNWMKYELDYRLEAVHLSRALNNFAGSDFVVIPKVFYEFSSDKVLTMEYIEGVSLNEIFDNVKDIASKATIDYKGVKFKKKEFIEKTADAIFKQVFEDGYFHADPHPANLILTKKRQLAYIDFGIVGVLDPRLKEKLLELFMAVAEGDVVKISKSFISLDEVKGHEHLPIVQTRIRDLLSKFTTGTALDMGATEIFYQLINIALECDIELPLSFAVLGKTLFAYDGEIRKADPQFDIITSFRKRFEAGGLEGFIKQIAPISIQDLLKQTRGFPQEFINLLRKLSEEGVEVIVRFAPGKR